MVVKVFCFVLGGSLWLCRVLVVVLEGCQLFCVGSRGFLVTLLFVGGS